LKVFVTGGAGFIGRNLVNSLLKDGHNVTIFDNLSNSSENLISNLLNNGANLVKGDITIQDQVSNSISGHDVVIHLAAKNSVEESIKFPEQTFSTNVDGTENILNSCVKYSIKNIVAASSAAVYGETQNLPISENQKTNPSSPYGESKLKMERLIQNFSKKHNLNSIILRIFNVYGIGQSQEYAGVITKFLEKISKNDPLEIFGDGLQTRDFVSVQDVIESIFCAISKIKGRQGTIFNIGSGKSVSINELAKYMISISNKNLDIKYLEEKDEIKSSQADISLAKKVLNYNPKIEFNDEVKNFIRT